MVRYLSLLLLFGCVDAAPRTQVMVFVRAEPDVVARAERLEIEVYGAELGGELVLRDTLIYTDSTSPDFFPLEWPRRVALVPEGDDSARRFTIVASAFESGTEFARTEVTSSYLREQTLTLDVWLRDDCIGLTCSSGTTCESGGCADVVPIDPCTLLVLETSSVPEGCFARDGGADASPDAAADAPDDSATDAATDTPVDAGTDAPTDAGPDPLDVYNVVFVSSETIVPGALGGIEAAHTHCQTRAMAAELSDPMSFRAFLSTSTAPASSLLSSSRGFVRVDGLPFADLATDFAEGKIFYPILLTEFGFPAAGPVVTGTGADLTAAGHCADWTDASAAEVTVGNPFDGPPFWVNRRFGFSPPATAPGARCNQPAAIYCFGTGRREMLLPPAPAAGSGGVFLSANEVPAGGGTAALDAACRGEGSDSYVAFLPSMASETALSRLGAFEGPWVRPDGVVVAENLADLAGERLLAAINMTFGGTYQLGDEGFGGVWSNAVAPDMTQSNLEISCTAWTNTTQRGRVAYHGRARSFYSSVYDRECTIPGRVYCISTAAVY